MNLPDHLKQAIETYVPAMEGGDWASMERRCEQAQVIYEMKPKVVVEIGTFGGASALPMAFALRENNNGGRLYCIDPYRVDYAIEGESEENADWYKTKVDIHDIHRKAMEAFWAHNIDNWLVVIRAASQYCFKLFPKIDVLLIDGNHSEEASFRDARLYVPNVVKGGWVMCDDEDWIVKSGEDTINSTQKAVEFIQERCDLIKRSGNMGFYRKR